MGLQHPMGLIRKEKEDAVLIEDLNSYYSYSGYFQFHMESYDDSEK